MEEFSPYLRRKHYSYLGNSGDRNATTGLCSYIDVTGETNWHRGRYSHGQISSSSIDDAPKVTRHHTDYDYMSLPRLHNVDTFSGGDIDILSSFDRSFQFSRKESFDIPYVRTKVGVGSQIALDLSTKKEPETRTTYDHDVADIYSLGQIHSVVKLPSEASIGVSTVTLDHYAPSFFDASYNVCPIIGAAYASTVDPCYVSPTTRVACVSTVDPCYVSPTTGVACVSTVDPCYVSPTIGAGCCTDICTSLPLSRNTGCGINANISDTLFSASISLTREFFGFIVCMVVVFLVVLAFLILFVQSLRRQRRQLLYGC